MITRVYHIQFLTPCFCGGANPSMAELRAASIRGELRWWFRCLGGNSAEENAVFGGILHDNPVASVLSVRILQQPTGGQTEWHKEIKSEGATPDAYLLGFFCRRTGRLGSSKGAIPPESKAVIGITLRKPASERLERTLRTFFSVGALGFRATRAAGAFASEEHALTSTSWEKLGLELKEAGFAVVLHDKVFSDGWHSLLSAAGNLLKNKLRSKKTGLGITARDPSPLGSAEPRQRSALLLRPVRIDGHLRLALIEAPHKSVLGERALTTYGDRCPIVDWILDDELIL